MVYQSRATVVLRLILGLLCSMLSTSYASPYFDEIAYSVLPRHSSKVSFILQTIAVIIMYEIQYFGIAYMFEINHPKNAFSGKEDEATKERMRVVKYSAYYSGINIILMATYAMVHIRYIEPLLPYYGYWNNRRYTVYHFFKEMLLYMFCFDTWFYWTHRMLHARRFLGCINFWSKIHSIHHDIVDPNAFSQDATHPFEAVIQGPAGHHTINYLFPIHPGYVALFLLSVLIICISNNMSLDETYFEPLQNCTIIFSLPFIVWIFNINICDRCT